MPEVGFNRLSPGRRGEARRDFEGQANGSSFERPRTTSWSEFYPSKAGPGDRSLMYTLTHQKTISLAETASFVLPPAMQTPMRTAANLREQERSELRTQTYAAREHCGQETRLLRMGFQSARIFQCENDFRTVSDRGGHRTSFGFVSRI